MAFLSIKHLSDPLFCNNPKYIKARVIKQTNPPVKEEKMKGGLEAGETSKVPLAAAAANRGMSILDFIFRVVAALATLGSAIAMGTTNETLPFFTQFIRFRAQYDDLPMFT